MDELTSTVFYSKYALPDEKSTTDTQQRIAKEFYRIEKDKFKKPLSYDEIYDLFKEFRYLVPAGSVLSGVGTDVPVSLSNCYFCRPPLDSYSSIIKTDMELANLCKRRGGVGVCIDNIRPAGSKTNNAAKTSTGIIPFMERYSNTIKEVAQHGRRGACLILIDVHHPEIIEFATVKNDPTKITGANISIKLSDEFLEAVKNNTEYELRFPVDKTKPRIVSKLVNARQTWKTIIQSAWLRAEPGLLFWDNSSRTTPSNCYKEYRNQGVNPCGELILGSRDSCRLMSINLFSFVNNPFTKKAEYDYAKLEEIVYKSIRMMDNLVDLESEKIDMIIAKVKNDPEPDDIKNDELQLWYDIKKHNDEGRRCGLGQMGLADTLAALNIGYGTEDSLLFVDKIGKIFRRASYASSVAMSKELGPFPDYNSSVEKDNEYIKLLAKDEPELYNKMVKYGRRNIGLLTIPPTGSISLLAETSSGIEPVFALSYTRRKKIVNNTDTPDSIDKEGVSWKHYDVLHPKLSLWTKITGETDITKSPYYNYTADKINWVNRVKLQGILQLYIDHSISSTINLPNETSENVVNEIYTKAWEYKLKGITVYREGCRDGVLVKDIDVRSAKKRPKELPCDIYHITVTKKLDKVRSFNYLVALGILNDSPYEIFVIENGKYSKKSVKGTLIRHSQGKYNIILDTEEIIEDITSETTDEEDSLTRMVSLLLRHNVPINYIMEQLSKVKGEMFCFAKSIARSLKKYIKDGTKSSENCPNCDIKLIYENGCFICKSCSYSKCT